MAYDLVTGVVVHHHVLLFLMFLSLPLALDEFKVHDMLDRDMTHHKQKLTELKRISNVFV